MSQRHPKIIVGSGWWSSEIETPWSLGDRATRAPEFFSLWHRQVIRCLDPQAIFITDSHAPRKPLGSHERVIWVELDRNYGHANDIRTGQIHTKYCGLTRSVLMGAMYALSCDADYYVYVEQDSLLRGDDFLSAAIREREADILLGERIENGKGIEGRVAAPFYQQSVMIVRRSGLERFITATLNAPETDGELSPELKMERDLKPFGTLAVPYGRSRPIDFSLSHLHAQHLTAEELDQFMRVENVDAGHRRPAVESDPMPPDPRLERDYDGEILRRSASDFEIRKNLHRLVNTMPPPPEPRSMPGDAAFEPCLWVFWRQGFDHAPPIVRVCLHQIESVIPESRLRILTAANLDRHVELPGYVHDRLHDNHPHFSDVVRTSLLAEHGGVWADATCFLVSNPLDEFGRLTQSGFFAFSRYPDDQYMLSNWFMAAKPRQRIPVTMRHALLEYWKTHDQPAPYFLFHYLFEAYCNQDIRFAAQWVSTHRLNAYDPHRLQAELTARYDADEYRRLLSLCSVHKLNHKIADAGDDSYYAHIVRGV